MSSDHNLHAAAKLQHGFAVSPTRRIRRALQSMLRRLGGSVMATSLLLTSPAPAFASVDGEMRNFMDDMGVQANVTGPTAYQGQSAGYYSLGSVWSRFPQKNVQPFNLQLPNARAGCGGIDLFAGSFSFINTAELVAMLKATANNAVGFAFKLAIDTISPEIGKVMDELAQKVQQMNQMNTNSCELAQGLVGGLWPKTDTASSIVCEAIANSQGRVADWARARQDCNNGGNRASHMASNTDNSMREQAGMKANYTWVALKKKYSGFDPQFREFLMTMVGTVIYTPPASDGGQPHYQFIGGAGAEMITAMLDGTSAAPHKIWTCDEEVDCLSPTQQNMVISASAAIKPRVRALLQSMAVKVRQPGNQLSPAEIQLLGLASIPVYKIMTVSAAAEFGIDSAQLNDLAEIVAVDLVTTMALRFTDLVMNARADFQGADADQLTAWRGGLNETRNNLLGLAARSSNRFDQAFQIIQRTQLLEKTLRTQLSPQLAASMRFSKSLSSSHLQ